MFIVFLKFSQGASRASELMEAHKEWIARGLADGVFLLVGSLQPRLGGALLAHGITRAELEARLQADPFVANDVVQIELFEVSASQSDPRLAFLCASR